MTIISLHMPKTAGTSFKVSLQEHFGNRFQIDNDYPLSMSFDERRAQALSARESIAEAGLGKLDCVHGHFLPVKYLSLHSATPLTFITWLREPVARLMSHYNYWLESYDPATTNPYHRQVVEEKWTFERFCLSEKFRNIYSQYLWDFPLENFEFIGISEYYQEDLLDFSKRYLPISLEARRENVTRNTGLISGLDSDFLERVRNFHAADVELYEAALRRRQERINAPDVSKASV